MRGPKCEGKACKCTDHTIYVSLQNRVCSQSSNQKLSEKDCNPSTAYRIKYQYRSSLITNFVFVIPKRARVHPKVSSILSKVYKWRGFLFSGRYRCKSSPKSKIMLEKLSRKLKHQCYYQTFSFFGIFFKLLHILNEEKAKQKQKPHALETNLGVNLNKANKNI